MATEEMSVFNVEPSRFNFQPQQEEANESAIADAAEDAALERGIQEQLAQMEAEFDSFDDEDEDVVNDLPAADVQRPQQHYQPYVPQPLHGVEI